VTGSLQLRSWRTGAGLSQRAAARMLGCNQSMICYLELGRRRPGRELARRIEEASEAAVPIEAWDVVRVERRPQRVFFVPSTEAKCHPAAIHTVALGRDGAAGQSGEVGR
jgi:transcriptional regulator with XRE-family HTH domain